MTRFNGKSALVFDWDGTLFDSMAYKRANYVAICMHRGISRERAVEAHERWTGQPRRVLFEAGVGQLSDAEFAEISSQYTAMNLASSLSSNLFADARAVLASLRGQVELFVSSSAATSEVQEVALRLGIAAWFKAILGSEQGFTKGKAHIDHICLNFGLKKADILFVGDDEQDLHLADAAGVDAVRVNRHQRSTQEIFTLYDLKTAIVGK